jgi:hypothetical protein
LEKRQHSYLFAWRVRFAPIGEADWTRQRLKFEQTRLQAVYQAMAAADIVKLGCTAAPVR